MTNEDMQHDHDHTSLPSSERFDALLNSQEDEARAIRDIVNHGKSIVAFLDTEEGKANVALANSFLETIGGARTMNMVCTPSDSFGRMMTQLPDNYAHDVMVYGERMALFAVALYVRQRDGADSPLANIGDMMDELFPGLGKDKKQE